MLKKVCLDNRVFTPPLTGVASLVKILEKELESKGIKTSYPKHVLPDRVENKLWSTKFKTTYPLEKIVEKDIDLFHSWWPFSPAPYSKNIPIIYTVHDLIPFIFKEEKIKNLDKYFKASIENATQIMCVSEYTKKDLEKHFDVKNKKIKVVYPGINERFFNLEKQPLINKIKTKKYILCVGSVLPHKNIKTLIDVYDASWPDLIIAGEEKEKLKTDKKNIKFTGYLTDKEIISLYDNALFFVFPTLYEGFGLPPLEAMARKCPVAASRIASVPEACGEAVEYFNPKNKKEIFKTLERLINDEKLRRELVLKGEKQVQAFSASAFGNRILKFYEDVAGE